VALGVAAQFELTMRQADVIGVWERVGQTEARLSKSVRKFQ